MAPAPSRQPTATNWSVEYDTARRQRLFRNPPRDHTAYPSLAAAIEPHVHSFNAVFEQGGLLEKGIQDIGTKVFLDGDSYSASQDTLRNKLSVRIKEVFLEPPALPPSNKHVTGDRRVFPSESRERHASYKGRLRARIEYRVNNGEWKESVRELGSVPIMLRVCD